MDINIKKSNGRIYSSRAVGAEPLAELHFSERNVFPASIWFLVDTFTPIPIPAPYNRIVLTARPNDDFDNVELPFQASEWTQSGSGSTLHYEATLRTHTLETTRLFTNPARTQYPILIDVDLMVSTNPEAGRFTIVRHSPARLFRALYRGDEGIPTPAVIPTPLVQFIDPIPATKTDFSMFPGGVAPESGLYEAADENFTYRFKGGWLSWKRNPHNEWQD